MNEKESDDTTVNSFSVSDILFSVFEDLSSDGRESADIEAILLTLEYTLEAVES